MKIIHKLPTHPSLDGDNVKIQRVHDFSGRWLDPFLMVDHIHSDQPKDFSGGFPPHPHRGIETLTYMLTGGFIHQDHLGHKQSIGAGQIQWMRAGSGIIHAETPNPHPNKGLNGFQIWINMAAKDKLKPPAYADSSESPLTNLTSHEYDIKLIAGDLALPELSMQSPIKLAGNAVIADFTIKRDFELCLSFNQFDTLFIFIIEAPAHQKKYSADHVYIVDSQQRFCEYFSAGIRFLLFAGLAHREPIAHLGPFVMNHPEEIQQAVQDYQSGHFIRSLSTK